MKSLLRTGSIPVQNMNRTGSQSGSIPSSPRISFRSENIGFGGSTMKRSSSDTDLIRSELISPLMGRRGSISYPDLGMIVEEEGIGMGVGNGKGNRFGGKGNGGNNDSSKNDGNIKLEEYYQEMIESNPSDSLLLRNYGKYLHEVKKNVEKAEEYYGRAILESPGDGELLSLYGNLIWETSKDEDRAQLYFDQAVHASPNDSMVLGSYAHFLWAAEDDEEIKHETGAVFAMVGAH